MVFEGNQASSEEENLVDLYRREGDIRVLGKLYDPYMSMVYGVCLKYLKNREESRDAVMQIFEKLVDTLRTHEVKNFKSWLYVLSRNYCLMALRSVKGKHFEEIGDQVMESEFLLHPEAESEEELNLEKMEKCLDELVTEQQWCVRLFFLQQKCYKEITVVTGYQDHKVKSYIQNGKRNLKLCMERNG